VTAESGTTGGTYTVLVELFETVHLEVGALGTITFDPGWYAYVGSALGPGGFSRIDRHRELAAGDRDVRHWHVDYLLGYPGTTVDTVVRTAGVDGECDVAQSLDGRSIAGFGCSDCDCPSHLGYSPRRAPLLSAVADAHRRLDGRTSWR